MSDLALRYLTMLQEIPRAPRRITVTDLHARLAALGHAVTRRSVERDLLHLERDFKIRCDDRSRPVGWSWPAESPGLNAPNLGLAEALALDLLGRYLQPLLPTDLYASLAPRLAEAQGTLAVFAKTAAARWRDRVAVIDAGPPLLPPTVAEGVIPVVHAALLNSKHIELDYHPVGADAPKRYLVNPVAMVYQGQVGYLIATLWNYPDLKQLALHRMSRATLLDQPAHQPKSFDLQRYLREQAAFDIPGERRIRLQLHVDAWLMRHLDERRLSEDQRISPGPDPDRWTVRATVQDSERLFWWLCSHGAKVEVVRPVGLRRRMETERCDAIELYRDVAT
jgi:predicted DNA-binding transcriptional regulator YafY